MSEATPEVPSVPGSMPFVHNLETAPAYWWLDILWVVLVDGADTGGRYSLMHETLPKGSGAPPHKHTWSDEHFYMLQGEISFLVGEEIKVGRAGDFVYVPRNTRHAFRVDGDGRVPQRLHAGRSGARRHRESAARARTRDPAPNATPMPKLSPEQYHRYGMDNAPGSNPFAPEGP